MIDPGESWAAVLGIKPVLSKAVEEITDGQFKEVADLETKITKRAKSLFAGSIVTATQEIVDYFKVLDQTSAQIDEAQVIAMIKPIPPDAQLPYMTIARNSYMLIQTVLPKVSQKTISGVDVCMPDGTAILQFSELFYAIDDPVNYIFGAISDGSITPPIVDAMRNVFPTLTQAITDAIQAQITVKGKGKHFDIPRKINTGLLCWANVKNEPPIPAPAPPPLPKVDDSEKSKDNALTQTEKVDSGVK